MRFGTIIRLFIILCIIACPIIITNVCDNAVEKGLYGIYAIYISIPFIIFWEVMCTDKLCSDCLMSGYCDKKKKLKTIKRLLLFLGYDKEKLNTITEKDLTNCKNKYHIIYQNVIELYEKN